MNVLLLQLDGKLPNLALMRLAAHHRGRGARVVLRHVRSATGIERGLWDDWDSVYASAIFDRSRPLCRRLLEVYPRAIVGGTGWDMTRTLASVGVSENTPPDYDDYPAWPHSIGFTQRGCRLRCPFCVVPRKEPNLAASASVWDIWRGEPWPPHLLLLDNDFFGVPEWRRRIDEIRGGGFKVCWNQGLNARLIGEEEAAAIATVEYRNDTFMRKGLYTAWDSRKDEHRLFRNLEALKRHGVHPGTILVYMLIGYWDGPMLAADDHYRRERLREFGCHPYPMPFVRTRELVGFQRWVVGNYDRRVPWAEWVRAGYEPRRLGMRGDDTSLFPEV